MIIIGIKGRKTYEITNSIDDFEEKLGMGTEFISLNWRRDTFEGFINTPTKFRANDIVFYYDKEALGKNSKDEQP